MKQRFKYILSALVAGILLTACSNDELVNIPSKELLNVGEVLLIDSKSESANIEVKANCHWKVTLEKGWENLEFAPKEGDGDGVIVIRAGVNKTVVPRTAKIAVESNSGVVKRNVEINQDGGDVELAISETVVSVDDTGSENKVINVTCNTDWKVESGASDIVTCDVSGGSQNGSVRLLIKENTTGSDREATIVFTAGTSTVRTLKVYQSRHVLRLTVLPQSITVGEEGDTRTIDVKSNTRWTVTSSDPEHFTPDMSQGNDSLTVKLEIKENMREDERTAVITFMVNDTLRQDVLVRQDGKNVKLSVPQTHVQAQAIGGSYSIPVNCNAEWYVASEGYWAIVPGNPQEGDGTINLECLQNTDTQSRTTQLIVIAGSKRAVVVVEQLPGMLPVVGTPSAQADGKYGATVSFSYQSNTSEISEYGVCYATHEHPTINDPHRGINYGLQTAANVTVNLSGLLSGTTYYLRPYVINATGISYGDEATITTAGLEPQEEDIGQPTWSRRKQKK